MIVKMCVCVIDCYQMQQSSSKRVGRKGQTKKERKLNVSAILSNNLEQGLMLLTCISQSLYLISTAFVMDESTRRKAASVI